MSFNKDIIWRKRRWGNHLGSECLICTGKIGKVDDGARLEIAYSSQTRY